MPGSVPKVINIDTISNDIMDNITLYFDNMNINIYDINQRKQVNHNLLTAAFRDTYEKLFKPTETLCNNQNSLIDYENTELLKVIVNKYIDICLLFNKSLGIMPFSLLTGIHYTTLMRWRDNPELNPIRCDIIKYLTECHKMEQIGLLNDTPVGALAVANNDKETGLNWAANQAQQIGAAAVYILPSERTDRLKLGKDQELQEITAPEV